MTARKSTPVGKAKAKAPSMAARRTIFLDVLRQTANVSRAQRAAGLASSTVYRQRRGMPAFRADWDLAMAEALDAVEEAVLSRARDGVDKPVFYGGAQIGTVRQYSDALAQFVLRSKRPEIYNRGSIDAAAAPIVTEMTEAEAEAEFDRRMVRLKSRP